MHWEDEKLVGWMQLYPGTRKSIISIYKELAKQCDPRYDRDDLSQQIILIFVQLLEEFDASKGVPLAGFLKSKLSNRVYNYFKSLVKTWKGEMPVEIFADDEDGIFGTYELDEQAYVMDIWCDIYKALSRDKFEALYWRYRANFCNSEIGIMLDIEPDAAGKLVDGACISLRYCHPFLEKYSPTLLESAVKKGQDKNRDKHAIKNHYHAIRKILQDTCNITIASSESDNHVNNINKIIAKAEMNESHHMRKLVSELLKRCNLTGLNPYATSTQA
jgi:hypothetical protein